MAELEMAIAEFYKTAGEVFQEDTTFLTCLAEEEILHVDYIGRMADLLKRNPQEFEPGRPLNIVAVNTAISGVRNYIQRLRNGDSGCRTSKS
jgi:hypothetical protein